MEHRVFKLTNDPIDECLDNLLSTSRELFTSKNLKEDIKNNLKGVIESVRIQQKEREKDLNKLLDFIKNESLFKFWKVKLNERENYYIYPYEYIESNQCLFAVFIDMTNTDYSFQLHDGSFPYPNEFLSYSTFEFEEITEEDFRKKVEELKTKPLDNRLWKLKNRDNLI